MQRFSTQVKKAILWTVCLLMMATPAALLAQAPMTCPAAVPAGVACYTGTGTYGSPYIIAMPPNWNGTLILYNHGASSIPVTNASALGAAILLLPEGYAVAAADYHFTVAREAAMETEDLRQIFVRRFGRPRRTVTDGLSFGGLVTARLIELYGTGSDGALNYHGAAPRCGVIAGTLKNTQHLLDLRVVYQYYCRNHPRPDEPQYELWRGLPAGAELSARDLQGRMNVCTGVSTPAAQRTEQQKRNLENILNVTHLAEGELVTAMSFATFTQAAIVHEYLGDRNPSSNQDVAYRGSSDDEALNRGVARYAADPSAAAALSDADDPTGAVSIPVVSMHTIGDGRRFVEQQSEYREAFEKSGQADRLLQIYTTASGHCNFSNPENVAQLSGLLRWLESGTKPSPEEFGGLCEQARSGLSGACRFDPAYRPKALATVFLPRRSEPRCGGGVPKIQTAVNAASFRPGLGTNSMITVFGSGWAADQTRRDIVPLDLVEGKFPLELACVGVSIGGIRAPVTFVTDRQINAQVPTRLLNGPARLEVIVRPGGANESRAELAGVPAGEYAPAFFVSGRQIVAGHPDGVLVNQARPARPGDIVHLYGTGFGVTEPVWQAGEIVGANATLRDPFSVTISGITLSSSEVPYAGLVVGSISGLYEFVVRLPGSLPAGDAPVTVRIGGAVTQEGATIPVRR